MKGNILRRIELLEKETEVNNIEEKDRIIGITYRNGNDDEFRQKLQVRMEELQKKYGPNIKEEDFFVVGIRKFYRQKEGE